MTINPKFMCGRVFAHGQGRVCVIVHHVLCFLCACTGGECVRACMCECAYYLFCMLLGVMAHDD